MDANNEDIEIPQSLSALVLATRESLLRAHYTEKSLQCLDRVWRDLEQSWPRDITGPFTREYGLDFLARRYGLVVTEDRGPATVLDQHRLRAIELLLDTQAHHPFANRRRRGPSAFAGLWAPICEAFVAFEIQAGRAARTMDSHRLYLTRFTGFLQTAGVEAPSSLDSLVLTEFIQHTGEHFSRSTLYCTSCWLRGFLRYLYRQGHTARDLTIFVPPVAGVKKAHLPSAYGISDVQRLMAIVDRANPKGRRDYAMILLACRLGLRASDICNLTFENFHWDTDILTVIQQKTGERVVLPLLGDVGTAVIEYIKFGRPAYDGSTVFLRHIAPVGPLTSTTLHSIVSHYLTRAGIPIPPGKKHGPHALRHSLASALLKQATPLPIIAAVLGHRDSTSTGTYLTIDLTQLRTLALEVPPVQAGW